MYDHLIQFATQRQLDFIEAIRANGSNKKAADALGVDRRSIDRAIQSLKIKAAQSLITEHSSVTQQPEGFAIKGTTTLIKDGKQVMQWVKSSANVEKQQELLRLTVEAMCQEIKPIKPINGPDFTHPHLLNVIPMGDPHFGLYSWAAECGDDFNTDLAKSLTLGAVDRLLQSSPNAETCIILPLGDIFHANDQTNATPAHHHRLDVDTRFQRVMIIGVLTFRHVIIKALERHQKVIVRFVKGNHDPEASFGLAVATAAFFSENPRVVIDLSPSDFWYYQHGKTLIGATHGDKVKHEQLGGIMAADRSEMWGATKHRYWYTGHVHSQNVREFPGVVCESFRTMAARDAYASGHGYRAGRDMLCITHHKYHGEVERHRCDIGMLD